MTQTGEAYRLSSQQHRLWKLKNAGHSRDLYAQAAVRVEGPFNIERLRQAIAFVTARHEALRTRLEKMPGLAVPVQVVSDSVIDVNKLVGEAGQLSAGLLQSMGNLAEKSDADSALICKVFTITDSSHLLLLHASALCADAASLDILVKEICAVYESGAQAGLGTVLQYADVAEWLNTICSAEDERSVEGCRYWQDRLSLISDHLVFLAHDFNPNSAAPCVLDVTPGADTTAMIRRGVERGAWTYPGFLLAAWVLLLERFGFKAASCIGISCNGRSNEMLRNSVGPLTRHVPVQLQFDRQMVFQEFAAQAETAIQEASDWQDYFTWDLAPAEENETTRLSYLPFSFEYTQGATLDVGRQGTGFTIERLHGNADLYGIHLCSTMSANGLHCQLHWDGLRYERKQMESLAAALAAVLEDAAALPSTRLARLRLVDAAESGAIAASFNCTRADFSASPFLLHKRFAIQVEQTPNAEAVRSGSESLTYQEFDRRTNQVANWLKTHGVGPETLVGICLDRSIEMAIAVFGVLKSGGAYVPLDPDYPRERLEFMLQDSNIQHLISTPHFAQRLSNVTAAMITVTEMCATASPERAVPQVESAHPAYVIYTSGSTGMPKGVVITHEAIANHMAWIAARFPLGVHDRMLQKTAFSFDASVWEFYAPLLSGACLVLARPGGQRDREYLVRCLQEEQITVLQLVPSQLQMLLEGDNLESCRSLRLVFSGGEALTREAVQRLQKNIPEVDLYNLYGPTEATIDASYGECRPGDTALTAPIGIPILNCRLYVLDEEYEPVPSGLAGELHIAGAGLARGYLNRMDLTAEKFIPDPFSITGGKRLYRTGDLVKQREDQQLEFIGRKDHQVKMRGYRIELGEIEAALAEQPGVQRAVVLLREVSKGNEQLVACITGENKEEKLEIGRLRDALKTKLPGYMVPGYILQLEMLPLTANGKVDRAALPTPADFRQAEQLNEDETNRKQDQSCNNLLQAIQKHNITVVPLVSDQLRMAIESGGLEVCRTVRRVYCTDEIPGRDLAQAFHYRAPWATLCALCGPAETTGTMRCAEFDYGELETASAERLVPNTCIAVLDREMNLAPMGGSGELYIGGTGLARGYLRKSGLTAETFVPDPFGGTPGGRLYRAGHNGRWQRNGMLEDLGLIRGQIKIRGHQFPIDAVREVLASHHAVNEVVVVFRPASDGKHQLVGYVTTGEPLVDPNVELREYLRNKIPDYMVPAAIIPLNKFPIKSNGQIDVDALPGPEQSWRGNEMLRGSFEIRLAAIWRELLNAGEIRRTDNFFELGGHSLLAITLATKIKEQFNQDLGVAAIFENPTIEHLAGLLQQSTRAAHRSHLVPLQREGAKTPIFFVHPLSGNIQQYTALANLLGKDRPFYGLQALTDEENSYEFALSLEERASRYLHAVQSIQPEGPYVIGGWSYGGYVAYEMARQIERSNQKVKSLIILDVVARPPDPFDDSLDEAEFLLDYARGNSLRFAGIDREMEQSLKRLSLESVQHQAAPDRLQYLTKELVAVGALPAETTIEQIEQFLKSVKRRSKSLSDYRLLPYGGGLALIRPRESLNGEKSGDITNGFSALCSGSVCVYFTPGNHFNMVYPPNTMELAQVIRAELERFEPAEHVISQ